MVFSDSIRDSVPGSLGKPVHHQFFALVKDVNIGTAHKISNVLATCRGTVLRASGRCINLMISVSVFSFRSNEFNG
jgi:hypothetical protein